MSEPGTPGGRLGEVLRARREALRRLRERGVEPFASRFERTATAADLHRRFASLPAGEGAGVREAVAGRIVLLRRHGAISFGTIRDATADLQLFLTAEDLGPGYELLDLLDLGDIVGAEGKVVRTRRGELSVRADRLVLLTKALRPLPEKWRGLRDPEARLRRRYLELISNPESRRVAWVRARVLAAFRRVLNAAGYLEVETPILQPTPGGALARPFATHHRALDLTLYLRIAPELYLKRLLVGGLERIYEIGRNFRNEGLDRQHNPEFTMLEVYRAYGDYEDMMDLAEALLTEAAREVRGGLRFAYRGRELDLTPPWPRRGLLELLSQDLGRPIELGEDLRSLAERLGVEVAPSWGPGKVALELFEKRVEPQLWGPVFVTGFPREVSPLARPHRSRPGLTEQFDLVVAGMEIGPAYSELTDPDEQRARFLDQQRLRAAGEEDAHPLDQDFLEALEHGMPPAGGMGIGIDRVTMILADVPSIRDAILFPHLRPEPGAGPDGPGDPGTDRP